MHGCSFAKVTSLVFITMKNLSSFWHDVSLLLSDQFICVTWFVRAEAPQCQSFIDFSNQIHHQWLSKQIKSRWSNPVVNTENEWLRYLELLHKRYWGNHSRYNELQQVQYQQTFFIFEEAQQLPKQDCVVVLPWPDCGFFPTRLQFLFTLNHVFQFCWWQVFWELVFVLETARSPADVETSSSFIFLAVFLDLKVKTTIQLKNKSCLVHSK